MTKKLTIFSSLFILSISFAFATNPVDPEKKEKEPVKNKKEVVNETDEVYKDLVVTEKTVTEPINQEEPISTEESKEPKAVQDDDVQSFNFLYYIIHQFKFSDFVTQ